MSGQAHLFSIIKITGGQRYLGRLGLRFDIGSETYFPLSSHLWLGAENSMQLQNLLIVITLSEFSAAEIEARQEIGDSII